MKAWHPAATMSELVSSTLSTQRGLWTIRLIRMAGRMDYAIHSAMDYLLATQSSHFFGFAGTLIWNLLPTHVNLVVDIKAGAQLLPERSLARIPSSRAPLLHKLYILLTQTYIYLIPSITSPTSSDSSIYYQILIDLFYNLYRKYKVSNY